MHEKLTAKIRKYCAMDGLAISCLVMQCTERMSCYSTEQKLCIARLYSEENSVNRLIENHATIVAEVAGELVGFAGYRDGEIRGLYVSPSVCRQGIGRMLSFEVERLARCSGLGSIQAAVAPVAVPFYEKIGFERTDESIAVELDVPFPVVKMIKKFS